MLNIDWFLKHQKILLWFINTPIIQVWFRWILRINGKRSSVGKNKIVGILPNAIFWKGKGKKVVAEFRTHDKFAKRLYYSFLLLWKLCHTWDTLFANIFQPAWNLGFDTITCYPAAGANNPADGYVGRDGVDNVWNDIRGGAGTGAGPSLAYDAVGLVCSATTNQFSALYRSIYNFDTSAIAGGTVSAATFSVYGYTKQDGISGTPLYHSCSNTQTDTSTVVSGDYQLFGSTSFGSVTYANYSTTAYNDISLDANGIANVSTSGISKFGARTSWDINNSAPTWVSNGDSRLQSYTADQTGTANDPKLVVTYTPAPAKGGFLFSEIIG